MQVGLEAFWVLLFLVLPGFVAALAAAVVRRIRDAGAPAEPRSAAAIIASGLVVSVLANAGALPIFAWSKAEFGLELTWSQLAAQLATLRLSEGFAYLGLLYGIATLAGLGYGLINVKHLHALLYALGRTDISPERDVWTTALTEIFEDPASAARRHFAGRPFVLWLLVQDGEAAGPPYLGRLAHSSARISREKPIELYLDPAYRLEDGTPRRVVPGPAALPVGLHLRLRPESRVEVFATPEDWTPESGTAGGVQAALADGADSGLRLLPDAAYCEGAPADSAHPGIYLVPDSRGRVACPYCGRQVFWAAKAPPAEAPVAEAPAGETPEA